LQEAVYQGIFIDTIFRGEHAPFLLLFFVLELQWINCLPREGTAEFLFDVWPGNLYLWILKDSKTADAPNAAESLLFYLPICLLTSTALGRKEE